MQAAADASARLVGRSAATRRIDAVTDAARAGRGGALVLRGEAGIGKTALLEHTRRVAGLTVIGASGAEFEKELPFAALHQLCLPVLDRLGELPPAHRTALQIAFGSSEGRPDPFHVGLAVLELLSAAALRAPLLCVVDDAQWLDAASSSTLAFLARRIAAEPVAMVLAVRLPASPGGLDELPSLVVTGLDDAHARELLTAVDRAPLDVQVRDRVVAEARGNPLALLELPRAGGFTPPDASPVPTLVERGYQERLADIPVQARLLLTVASADPTGDPALLWPAARLLHLDVPTASASAIGTGLVDFGNRIRFCHPLARSAVYRAAEPGQRRAAHRVLAEVTDARVDPDRRAWHRAQASGVPDDDVAAELERSAARARARGGVAAAAAFLDRAAALSLDPARRVERTLAAAAAMLEAGATETAAELLASIEDGARDELRRAHADLLRGQIAFTRRSDANGPRFMLRAAQRLAELDPERSRECFVDALEMSLVVGRASGVLDDVIAAAEAADRSSARSGFEAARPRDVLDALALLGAQGHRAAIPLVRTVLFGDRGPDGPLWTRRPALAGLLASELWDPVTHATIAEWVVRSGRQTGSPLQLRLGLAQLASTAALEGNLGAAVAAIAEDEAIADATGGPPVWYHRLQVAAMRGRRAEARELFEAATVAASTRGSGQLVANVHWAAAVLSNSLNESSAALAAARRAISHRDLFLTGASLPELVEAAVRCGEHAEAARALESLTERTAASGTATGLGVAAYARGLVTGAEDDYRESIAHLEASSLVPYRARAYLLYGEWLRRRGRRKECREHLRTAHELASAAGLEAFARRAADELGATGDRVQSRSSPPSDLLTVQELRVARLVGTGATSNEVAARLFLSPRTVDAHLRSIFRKLGITSRRNLRDHPALSA